MAMPGYRLIYNGVELLCLDYPVFNQSTVYSDDGVDALYTHFRIEAIVMWNPYANATQQPGAFLNNNGGQRAGDRAAVSIAKIRQTLLQPRHTLVVYVGNDEILRAPMRSENGVTFATDANNGPKPVSFDVTGFSGTKTLLARYVIECDLAECTGSTGNPIRPLLSHRWTMSESLDENYLSTVTIRGTAVVRRDMLDADFITLDDLRSSLMHPVPPNFRRGRIEVTPSSDGVTFQYTTIDEEQPKGWNVAPGKGIIRIEGWWEDGWDQTAGWSNPVRSWHLHVEVWGYPDAKSQELVTALLQAAKGLGANMNLIAAPGVRGFLAGLAARIRVDFPDRHASLDYHAIQSGLVAGMASFANLLIDGGLGQGGWKDSFGIYSDGSTDNPPPPSGNSRGLRLVELVSQALRADCRQPDSPGPWGKSDDVNLSSGSTLSTGG